MFEIKKEYTVTNKEGVLKDIYLHDAELSKIIWDYQERIIFFDIKYLEFHYANAEVGRLSFHGAVYMEGSALGLWCTGVDNPIHLDCIFADDQCSVPDLFTDCVKKSGSSPENCVLPNPDEYFCVSFGTTAGDRLRFVVEKVVWEVPVNPDPLFSP